MQFSEATFTKHTYGKPKKRTLKPLENFDPRPLEYRGTAVRNLPELLEKVRGKGLSISLSLDPLTKFWSDPSHATSGEPRLPSKAELQASVSALKASLALSPEKVRDIEQHTRNQSHTSLWYEARRYRLTASFFGAVSRRRPSTSPHSLVLSIIEHRSFQTAATEWGKKHEDIAIEQYVRTQRDSGHSDLYACKSGFVISDEHPFLGASPDAAVYDPSATKSFGVAEVKCPYSFRNMTPTEACSKPHFFCTLGPESSTPVLKKSHQYYAQVQGQMAITKREWYDFVIYTEKGLSIERINFDEHYWKDLLEKLVDFYDNCLGPEIVSPVHVLGSQVRDLNCIVCDTSNSLIIHQIITSHQCLRFHLNHCHQHHSLNHRVYQSTPLHPIRPYFLSLNQVMGLMTVEMKSAKHIHSLSD